MNYEKLKEKTEGIIQNLYKINYNNSKIHKKIIMVNNVYKNLQQNKVLKQENNNNKLLFQSNVLKNEYNYYKNIYDIILDKYSKEIYELSEHILIILISLNKLEINNIQQKNNIYSKIIYSKKLTNVNFGTINEIVNNITNNLKLVDDFIKLFDNYINDLVNQNKFRNIHNNTFEVNAKYKKENILLEYNKYCDKFNKVIDYFNECCESVVNQIETSNLLKFFLKLKD